MNYVFDLIHDKTPPEMKPSPKRMIKFLSQCNGQFGTENCVFWGVSQDKFITVNAHDITKKRQNMYFFLNGKLRHVKSITFSWCYGVLPETSILFVNTCQNDTCINPCHLTHKNLETKMIAFSETKFKSIRNSRILNAMKCIHENTPSKYVPDYSTFVKFVSNCVGDWESKTECVYWNFGKRFILNNEKISPKKICFTWKFGEFQDKIKKKNHTCKDINCINMNHLVRVGLKRRKIEYQNL